MPESDIETSGPSLEQILWRAMDRWAEPPALVDAEEFAAHIAGIFQGDLPAEAWVERFFVGHGDRRVPPADIAEAIVQATRERLHVYEFDLRRLEYLIVEDKEQIVVVSRSGQFALASDDFVRRAIDSAIVPDSAKGKSERIDRSGREPKAYLLRASGELVAVDAGKVARSLEGLLVRQVSAPAVAKPGRRLSPFAPLRRVALSEEGEARSLRQDQRTRQPVPRLEAAVPAPPPPAQTALFVVLPDGTFARAEMGAATRWQQMIGRWSAREGRVQAPAGGQRITVNAGNVVAVIKGGGQRLPGTAGERALARSEGLSAVRGDSAPIRVLGDDDLARALARGATVVPSLAREGKFWLQPESAFRPDKNPFAQGGSGAGDRSLVAQPLQLGQITGDPWADWALTGGSELQPAVMMALRRRTRHALRSSIDEMSIAPEQAERVRGARSKETMRAGAPVVGFRSADGSVIVQRAGGPVRLAAFGRPDAASQRIDLPLPRSGIAPLTGALPPTALAALRMALEHTAGVGGYKLPILRLGSASDAFAAGAALQLPDADPRRKSVRLAGPISVYDAGASGQVARLMLSMPFPNGGEVHVGEDLAEALQAYLGAPIMPAVAVRAAVGGGPFFKLGGGGSAPFAGDRAALDWSGLHEQAARRAADAVMTLDLPSVPPLRAGSQSVSGLPLLLHLALAQSGDWTPGPGAPMPAAIREVALRPPFQTLAGPELVERPLLRPLNVGEEEIVIPRPLWAQMGRGLISDTDQIMASTLAPDSYAPPLGVYRLVVRSGGPVDMTGGDQMLVVSAERGSASVGDASNASSFVAGLQPGMWSGYRRSQTFASPSRSYGEHFEEGRRSASGVDLSVLVRPTHPTLPTSGGGETLWSGYRRSDIFASQSQSHGGHFDEGRRSASGVDLSGLARPIYPSLRFRYVGAPLWWSGSTRSAGLGARPEGGLEDDSSPGSRALQAGVRAANSAASIWRSILVAGPRWGGRAEDDSGGMDQGRSASSDGMSSLSRRFDPLSSASLVAGGAASDAGAGAGAAYLAVSSSGAAGMVSSGALQRARADAVEMSIVAAIQPSPPPLETMGFSAGRDAPHARPKQGHGPGSTQSPQKEATDGVSHSKIEGSVDAIAQRIYHRIRRRIQNDRERFGG